ncbi:plexin-C1-like isoform X2 [Myxocyprinus asiaticus]|uniref:plexin-C1-like isoform X2 n=1 Tax=Myxocyprinus asiaticus TaxID=70543 RepID=UPI002223055A|nr:plexin-C1-like isoform X2 [Myxocyprinus asiaticus]
MYKMRGFLFGILVLVKYCLCKDAHNFDGDIKDFVVGKNKLYVLTEHRLHQMKYDLIEEKRKDINNATHPNTVTILVPFDANGTLVTCGTSNGGYCEVLDINDITNSIYWERLSVGPQQNETSVAFIVDTSPQVSPNGTYLLVGRKDKESITLRNTLDSDKGGIFSKAGEGSEAYIEITRKNVEFVDGFQVSLRKLSYVFLNAETETEWKVHVLRLNNSKIRKTDIIKNFKVATIECCNDTVRPVLLASTVIPSVNAVIWAGVFSAQNQHDPENTALAFYNISHIEGQVKGFCSNGAKNCDTESANKLKPLAVVFKHGSMTSVAAAKNGPWIVLFIGTKDGQLIKLVLDETFKAGCPTILYKSDDERAVFPKIHLDPVDSKHVYIALKNQIRKVPVVQCAKYSTMKDCRISLDPHCGWCVNTSRCSTKEECLKSSWLSIPSDSLQKELLSFQVAEKSSRVIALHLALSLESTGNLTFSCAFTTGSVNLCDKPDAAGVFPNCSCSFSDQLLFTRGLTVSAAVTIGDQKITEMLTLRNCSSITNNSAKASYTQCVQCISAGCHWSSSLQQCVWTHEFGPQLQVDLCKDLHSGTDYKEPEILSLEPNKVSFRGRNRVLLRGTNLESVTKIHIRGDLDCIPKEAPVFERSSDTLRFHIPPSETKGTMKVCAVTPDGRCHGNSIITYSSQPSCTGIQPKVTWNSGGRKIHVQGANMEFVESIIIGPFSKELITHHNTSSGNVWFHSHPRDHNDVVSLSMKVGNSTLNCVDNFSYLPDPEYTEFTTSQVSDYLLVTIQKKADKLNLSESEVNVTGLQGDQKHECALERIESNAILCKIKLEPGKIITVDTLIIHIGHSLKRLEMSQSGSKYLYILVALILLIILGTVVGVVVHRKSQIKMNERMNKQLEMLESNIRRDIRQGFVDLQTEKSDLIDNIGAIPFLDYKHFASKIFFPEASPLATLMIKDIGQDSEWASVDEKCQALAVLVRDKQFLSCFVHALEEQKNFSIKDKCTVASLLTVALHGDLLYLTEVMEDLLQSLMDQSSNANPKLLLRRTESIVEKLLTNWMSICLYGYLRESVGQPLFLLVSALTQQISKGPVDSVTEKALYTLSEDWLLCQAQDFEALKLQVLFAVGTDGEVSEPLEVNALTCDTIHQVKEKILQTFQRKFGFPYTQQIRDIEIEYEKAGNFVLLQEVDDSSEIRGHVTMLNTLRHYQVADGACIKVITISVQAPLMSQNSVKDDENFSTKYFHLVDPDIDIDLSKHPERKEMKFKEMYLTKLLSTKVAVHSFVENLFKNIWGLPNNRGPLAVKYFFDFLDAQAERKKISDPDVIHIWKTNSLPLRFWVNILKNPDFVFSDMEKTPHLDGCLSVIAQAFMDSFSLAEQHLDKHSPTNKLLYAKDIPKYKLEVKMYYKIMKDTPSISNQEFKMFLQEESKKHENEFNESAALRELYKYMARYFSEISQKLEQTDAPTSLKEEMQKVKELFDNMKRSAWS